MIKQQLYARIYNGVPRQRYGCARGLCLDELESLFVFRTRQSVVAKLGSCVVIGVIANTLPLQGPTSCKRLGKGWGLGKSQQ